VLSSDGLHVIDAWPAAETHEVAHLTLTGEPRRLYLLDNRLVVYTRVQANTTSGGAGSSNPSDQGCTYGYNCRFSSEGGHTLIIVFDVTNPAARPNWSATRCRAAMSTRAGSGPSSTVWSTTTGANPDPGSATTHLAGHSYDDLQTKFQSTALADNNAKDRQHQRQLLFALVEHHQARRNGRSTEHVSAPARAGDECVARRKFRSLNAFDLTKLQSQTRTVLGTSPGYVYSSPTALYMAVRPNLRTGLFRAAATTPTPITNPQIPSCTSSPQRD